jgi:hypothetical protein
VEWVESPTIRDHRLRRPFLALPPRSESLGRSATAMWVPTPPGLGVAVGTLGIGGVGVFDSSGPDPVK